ncbi:MAG: hypothetical protein JOZ37_05370 [Actinobacteria bacterium]|nr:hypothetical protein [Actinomycetota bacterium]MBV9254747.1 hypothetical protein [Actinomycetota bacterium]MBV9663376.1 hypothetical protein [Actinomycetota bacterium]MBV9936336.1 hypothetical protein [Actinomycetota bacterium]
MRAFVFTLLTCAALVMTGLTGCGKDRTGGPRGTPDAVVTGATDATFRAGRADVQAATADTTSSGWVDLARRQAHVTLAGRDPGGAPVLLRDPLLAVELLRGATQIEEYGGAEVRGASTIRYQFEVDPKRASVGPLVVGLTRATFYADAWIDSAGRVRQVVVPLNISETRPVRRSSRVPAAITVQFFDYAQEGR